MDYQFHFCELASYLHFRPNTIQKSYEGFVAPLSLGCKELDGEHPRQYPWFTSRRFLGCSAFFAVPGWWISPENGDSTTKN